MKFNGMRLTTNATQKKSGGMAGMIVKLQGCELNHRLAELAIDVMGEYGILFEDSPFIRDHGMWQTAYMFDLGLIIGGGSAQIQKNIISERGLDMPREPKVAKKEDCAHVFWIIRRSNHVAGFRAPVSGSPIRA